MLKHNQLIAHQVLFKFKEGYGWNSQKAIEAERVTRNHINEIPEILAWFCGKSTVSRHQAVDFSLIGYFKNYDDLNAYMVHSDHIKGVKLWREISTWKVSDIIVEGYLASTFSETA